MDRLGEAALLNLDALLDCRTRGAMAVEVRQALRAVIAEVVARRAADLSDEERMALKMARNIVDVCIISDEANVYPPHDNTHARRALAVLDRLLATTGGAK